MYIKESYSNFSSGSHLICVKKKSALFHFSQRREEIHFPPTSSSSYHPVLQRSGWTSLNLNMYPRTQINGTTLRIIYGNSEHVKLPFLRRGGGKKKKNSRRGSREHTPCFFLGLLSVGKTEQKYLSNLNYYL